jgi:hypothetical protein
MTHKTGIVPEQRPPSVGRDLLVWFLFPVGFTISPLFFNYFLMVFWNRQPAIADILGNGELYLIAIPLTATALGQMFLGLARSDAQVGTRMVAAFTGLLVIGVSVLFYGALQSYRYLEPHLKTLEAVHININQDLLFKSSWTAFAVSIVVGVYATITSTWANRPRAGEAKGGNATND